MKTKLSTQRKLSRRNILKKMSLALFYFTIFWIHQYSIYSQNIKLRREAMWLEGYISNWLVLTMSRYVLAALTHDHSIRSMFRVLGIYNFDSIVKIKIREQPFDLCELSRGSSQGLEKNLIGRLFHNWYVLHFAKPSVSALLKVA